jgi:hypothetical protein
MQSAIYLKFYSTIDRGKKMKKMILGVLGITILYSLDLVASENMSSSANPVRPVKTREAFAAGSRDIVRRASQELEKRNGEPLSCSTEIRNQSVSVSTETLRKATVNMDYGFPGSGNLSSLYPSNQGQSSQDSYGTSFHHIFYGYSK